MLSRFDYIQWDKETEVTCTRIKTKFVELEEEMSEWLAAEGGRSLALAFTALEESFMWVGKALRDAQIKRNGEA